MSLKVLVSGLCRLSDAVANALLHMGRLARDPVPCLAGIPSSSPSQLEPWRDDGLLWAVPTNRRTVERRMWRRIGHPFYKVTRKVNIKSCEACGHFHLRHTICGHCYEKVKQETELLRDAIQNELKLDPVEKEVAVVYQGEPRPELPLRVVEIPRERPAWFSKNLLAPENTKS